MTRLFVLSDTHGRPWPTIPSDADAVLFAGDLVDGATADEDTPADVDAVTLAWLRRTAGLADGTEYSRVVAVRGNHDVADPARFFAVIDDLSFGRLRRIGERLWVGGLGWHGERYFELPIESDLQTRADLLRRAVRRQVMPGESLILLTHYPPALVPLPTDSHAGAYSATVAALVAELRPLAVVAGHMHAWAGTIARMLFDGGETLLVMPGPAGAVLDIASDGILTAKVNWRAGPDRGGP